MGLIFEALESQWIDSTNITLLPDVICPEKTEGEQMQFELSAGFLASPHLFFRRSLYLGCPAAAEEFTNPTK